MCPTPQMKKKKSKWRYSFFYDATCLPLSVTFYYKLSRKWKIHLSESPTEYLRRYKKKFDFFSSHYTFILIWWRKKKKKVKPLLVLMEPFIWWLLMEPKMTDILQHFWMKRKKSHLCTIPPLPAWSLSSIAQ